MKRHVITISKTQQGYMAKDTDPMVLDLFGTDTLPTCYTAQADPEVVLQAITVLNPDKDVRIEINALA